MITFTPRYRIDEEERADREVKKKILRKIDLLQIWLEETSMRNEIAEKLTKDLHNTEDLKKRLLVLMECCVNSGNYFKWRLYKLYTLRTKSVYDRIMIQQCERYLDTTHKEWEILYNAYMDLVKSDNSPCEITMNQFWR